MKKWMFTLGLCLNPVVFFSLHGSPAFFLNFNNRSHLPKDPPIAESKAASTKLHGSPAFFLNFNNRSHLPKDPPIAESKAASTELHGSPAFFLNFNNRSHLPKDPPIAESKAHQDLPTAELKAHLASKPTSTEPLANLFVPQRQSIPQNQVATPHEEAAKSKRPTRHVIGLEGRVAYFIPQDHKIRRVYGKHGFAEYELEGYVPVTCLRNCEPDWVMWGNLSFYEREGHSTCLHHRTHMMNLAFNIGTKYYFCHYKGCRPYLGIGMGFAYVNFHDHADYVRSHIHEWGYALLLKSGAEFDLARNVFADVFIDYSGNWFGSPHSKSCVHTRSVNTGGAKFGLGLGYRF